MYKWVFIIPVLIFSCSGSKKGILNSNDQQDKAIKLSQQFLIADGHVDLPYRLRVINFRFEKEFLGIPIESAEGDFDYKRSKEGGLDAPFMSIYIPSRYQIDGGAKLLADSLINMVQGIIHTHPNKFASGNSPAELRSNFERGLISLPLGMENGAPLEDDLTNVKYFHSKGIRYITLTHAKDNQICDSSYDTTGTWQGLSPFGRKVVAEMNQVGIMIDISHVTDNTFYQVMDLTIAPVIASHSSCRKFTPGVERNMSDDMLRALKKNGGVIMINFGTFFLDSDLNKKNEEMRNELNDLLSEKGLDPDSQEGKEEIEMFRKDHPKLYADVERVADHIDHVVKLVGVDHVGFGSDFDGVGDSLPTGLKDVSQYPNLINVLLKRGYSESDIEKICSGNLLRVWSTVEKVAARSESK